MWPHFGVCSATRIGVLVLSLAPLFAAGPPDVHVSQANPFTAGCDGAPNAPGVNFPNAEVEPWVAVDPNNPRHLIGVWQQDRWSNGGARGLLGAVSFDAGDTWTSTSAHFSRCTGGTAANNGNYERATDPWVTFSPDGTAYFISYSFDQTDNNQAVLVSRSTDGGITWSEPTPLIADTAGNVSDDKETITADPTDSRYVYAVWDRLIGSTAQTFHGPAWFSRTTDGGQSWEPARAIHDPGRNAQTIGNQIVVLPEGTVINLLTIILNATGARQNQTEYASVMRSTDKGATWSAPVTVATNMGIGVTDAKTGEPIRTGTDLESIAVDRTSGALYITWEDARFSGSVREGIAFSKSTDGGLTWTTPVQVNRAPNVQAFNPAIAVTAQGRIGITYYDFRYDTTNPGTLMTNAWLITSDDGGDTWREYAVAGPFDLLSAPVTADGPFLGDYEGIVGVQDTFLSFFVAANTGDTTNPTDVFASNAPCEFNVRSEGRPVFSLHNQYWTAASPISSTSTRLQRTPRFDSRPLPAISIERAQFLKRQSLQPRRPVPVPRGACPAVAPVE